MGDEVDQADLAPLMLRQSLDDPDMWSDGIGQSGTAGGDRKGKREAGEGLADKADADLCVAVRFTTADCTGLAEAEERILTLPHCGDAIRAT